MTDKTDALAYAAQDLLSAVERDWPNSAAWHVKTLMLADKLRAELAAYKAGRAHDHNEAQDRGASQEKGQP